MIAQAILDQYGRPFARQSRGSERLQSAPQKPSRRLAAKYDFAQTTDTNANYWSQADALDADAANTLAVRKKGRERARYEVANNAYLAGIVQREAMYEIGSGPTLQVHTQDDSFNAIVESAWASWADAVDLAGILRVMVHSRVVDGEAFAMLATNPKTDDPVTLTLVPIECDRITACGFTFDVSGEYIDGITFDRYGNPTIYEVLDYHPGSVGTAKVWGYTEVSADEMVHLFTPTRPGQHRGVTEVGPSLSLLPGLRRFTSATIVAAETAAKVAVLLESQLAAGMDPDELAPGSVEIPFGSMVGLPEGWKASQIKAEHPNTLLEMFRQQIIGEAASPLSMPRNIAMCDSSQFNFASGQLDHLPYFGQIAVRQSHIRRYVLRKVFAAWYYEASREYEWPKLQRETPAYTFNWVGKPYANPVDEATAAQTNLQTGSTTFPLEYSRRGMDCVTEWRKQAAALGMTLDQFRALLVQSIYGQAVPEPPSIPQPVATPQPPAQEPANAAP